MTTKPQTVIYAARVFEQIDPNAAYRISLAVWQRRLPPVHSELHIEFYWQLVFYPVASAPGFYSNSRHDVSSPNDLPLS